MRYVLGIDQGGTKTIALVADESGNILGKGLCGGACFFSKGMDKAMRFIREASDQALAQAGLSTADICLVAGGIIGADWPHEYNKLGDALWKTLGIDKYLVYNDCITAFRAGTNRGFGSVLCLGTGMNTAVRSPGGEEFIFGVYVPDEDQGATGLVIRAMNAIFKAQIGIGGKTKLTDKVLRYLNLKDVDDLIFRYQRNMFADSQKALYELLLEAVQEADEVSLQILREFAVSISRYVVAGLERFDMTMTDADIVLSGGVFKMSNPLLVQLVTKEILRKAPNAKIVNAGYEPAVGTILTALDNLYGCRLPDIVLKNIETTAKTFAMIREKGKGL